MGAYKENDIDNKPFFQSIAEGYPDYGLLTIEGKFPNKPGIYGILNQTKSKVYVGQSGDVWARMCGHRNMLNTNRHHCREMSDDYLLDNGVFVFFTIETISNLGNLGKYAFASLLSAAESRYINMVPEHMLYNVRCINISEDGIMANNKLEQHLRSIASMNDATRHDTATIVATHRETGAQLRDRLGVNPRTMQRRWRDTFGVSFASNAVATPEQVATIEQVFGSDKTPRVAVKLSMQEPEKPAIYDEPVQPIRTENPVNVWYIRIPLLSATIASVANMWLICLHLSDGDKFSAGIMTAVFSGSALCFIAARAVGFWPTLVMWVLIAFEAFTNTTGVYYGLLGRTGTPTRFLGMVTDILGTGTHYTAIGLGSAMAVIIGAVQIVSIRTLIKNIK